jgi:hypothetical protein
MDEVFRNSLAKICNMYEPSWIHGMSLTNAQDAANLKRTHNVGQFAVGTHLLLYFVCAAEHVVNVGEVVGTGEEAIGFAAGGIALLEVGFLTEVAHLKES